MKQLIDCKNVHRDYRFSRSEEGKTFVLESANTNHFSCEIVDIEGCVLKHEVFDGEEISKCDWLFLVNKNQKDNKHLKLTRSKAFYIELKGINVKKACQQIYTSIDRTKSQISDFEIVAKIVSPVGYHPKIENNEYYRKVKRLIKKEIDFAEVNKKNRFTHIEKI